MFRNWKLDNAARKDFSSEFIQIGKPKWGYARNLNFLGKSIQNQTVVGKNKWCPEIAFTMATRVGDVYTATSVSPTGLSARAALLDTNEYFQLKPDTLYTITFVVSKNTLSNWVDMTPSATAWTYIDENGNTAASNQICSGLETGTFTLKRRTKPTITSTFALTILSTSSTGGQEFEFKIMIAEGNVSGAFEPYVYPSPSPNLPQPIYSVPSSFNITSCGKNLWSFGSLLNKRYWASAVLNNTEVKSMFKPNTTYTFSYSAQIINKPTTPRIVSTGTLRFILYKASPEVVITLGIVLDAEYDTLTNGSIVSNIGQTFTTPNSLEGFTILGYTARHSNGTTIENAEVSFTNIQLEVGTNRTAYTPYIGTTTPILLKDTNNVLHTLKSLPDGTRDELALEKVKKLTITSATSPYEWYYQLEVGDFLRIQCTDINNKWTSTDYQNLNMYCNIAKADITAAANHTFMAKLTYGTMLYMSVPKAAVTAYTTAAIREYLNNQIATHGNIEFQYPLSSPVAWTLHPDEQKKIITVNDTVCNIFTDAAVQPTIELNAISYGE